ncbi:ATP-binding protein [Embleya scabrispora]|uniref:ATP-binding protein n=1 Tax=Embleya scabrispora TaxID=159449 RepID=UPI0003789D32|nr:ATP-binding protein [Embleya scabrispora]MYS84330.1 ATP-binding protein [Streptomyces sp. SID5474]
MTALGRARARTRHDRRAATSPRYDADVEHRPGPVFVRWTIAPTVAGVPEVRHRLRELLRAWGAAEEIEDTMLLVATELTSNAVRHAAIRTERIRITASHSGAELRLEVADDHPFRPHALLETGPESEDGRGLMIVKLMVAELGGHIDVLPIGAGKSIRVVLREGIAG